MSFPRKLSPTGSDFESSLLPGRDYSNLKFNQFANLHAIKCSEMWRFRDLMLRNSSSSLLRCFQRLLTYVIYMAHIIWGSKSDYWIRVEPYKSYIVLLIQFALYIHGCVPFLAMQISAIRVEVDLEISILTWNSHHLLRVRVARVMLHQGSKWYHLCIFICSPSTIIIFSHRKIYVFDHLRGPHIFLPEKFSHRRLKNLPTISI